MIFSFTTRLLIYFPPNKRKKPSYDGFKRNSDLIALCAPGAYDHSHYCCTAGEHDTICAWVHRRCVLVDFGLLYNEFWLLVSHRSHLLSVLAPRTNDSAYDYCTTGEYHTVVTRIHRWCVFAELSFFHDKLGFLVSHIFHLLSVLAPRTNDSAYDYCTTGEYSAVVTRVYRWCVLT
jgi:hypothetical protein